MLEAKTACGGVQVHVTDRAAFRPVETGVALIEAFRAVDPDRFAWKQPPYEYEYDRLPIDLLFVADVNALTLTDVGNVITGSYSITEYSSASTHTTDTQTNTPYYEYLQQKSVWISTATEVPNSFVLLSNGAPRLNT